MARGEVVPTRQDAPGETTRYSGTPGMLEDPVYGEARVATLSGRISEATDVLAEDSRTPFSPELQALRPHLYKLRFPDAIQNFPPLMAKFCRLVDLVRVSIVERPREGNSIEAVADAIERDLAAGYRSRNAASVA